MMLFSNSMFYFLGEEWGKKRKSGGKARRRKKKLSDSDEASFSSDDSGAPKKKRGKQGKPTGFLKELQVSEDLEAIIGVEKATRAEVVKQMWAYIKENKLQVW